ncbi:MAG: molybdenum cofactor guanylyltransferase [Chloroflexota bacterium]
MNRNLAVVIQAGGQSSRMGRDKGLVELAGRPMIDWVIDQVVDMADDVLITTNNIHEYVQFGLRMASDPEPGAGALPGLRTALSSAMGPFALVIACDMPFVNRGLLEYQVEKAFETQADVVVPVWDGRMQTMHAVYRRENCLNAVDSALAAGKAKMTSFYDDLNVLTIGVDEVSRFSPTGKSFKNINTPEELEEAERIMVLS